MARFTLTIDIDNAAFDPDPTAELARILRQTAARVEAGATNGAARDINGNRVGTFGTH